MKVILNHAMLTILNKLQICYSDMEYKTISGYRFVQTEKELFYLEECPDTAEEAVFVRIDRNEIWKVDKLMNCFRFRREEKNIQGESVIAYVKREKGFSTPQDETVEGMSVCLKKERQLDTSDLYLMIPGKLEQDKMRKTDTWDLLHHTDHEIFDIFSENIEGCIRSEYRYNFADSLERKCLGEIILEIENDYVEKKKFRQSALAEIVRHETGICILEIFVYNCSIGGNKLLNYFRSDELTFEFKGEKYKTQELLKLWHIRPYGKKRSMVFAYGDVSDEAVINALVNEEYPMGKVGGTFRRIVEQDNVAQYDTAQVYVSSTTMLERCKSLENYRDLILDNRIAYHAIEIFFVELLLFQDASIDKIYLDVKREQLLEETETDIEQALERYEQIGFDMGKAMDFSDYEQFVFPTTRESAKRVAERFGIHYMFEKYEINRQLLENMISSNKRQMEYKQDRIKNSFLLVISGLTLLGTLGESFYNIFESMESGVLGYGFAILLIVGGFFLYELVLYLYNKKIKKVKKNDK